MSKLIIIDLDFILWKVIPAKVQTETELMFFPNQLDRTFEQVCKELDEYLINKIFIPAQADCYIGYLGGDGVDFRRKEFPEYKSNRIGKELPKYFKECKQYLVDKWKAVYSGNLEADDCCLITEQRLKNDYEVVIVCQDKDILNTEGIRYNPVKDEWYDTTSAIERKTFWGSLIIGDSADGVIGLKGLGLAHWKKLIDDPNIDRSYPELVFREYLRYYKWDETLALENFYKNYKLLKILREKEDFIISEIQIISKEEVINNINIEF